MLQYALKTAITLIIILAVSAIAKKSTIIGGILVSLPLVSLLAMMWLWVETKNKALLAQFSANVFWLVLPSLVLFATLPLLLKKLPFGWALLIACGLTIAAYYLMVVILGIFSGK